MFNPEQLTEGTTKAFAKFPRTLQITKMAANTIVLNRNAQERKVSDDGINRLRDSPRYCSTKNN